MGRKPSTFCQGSDSGLYGTLVDKDLANGKEFTFLLTPDTDDEETYTVQLKTACFLFILGPWIKPVKIKSPPTSSGLFAILNQDTDRQALLLEVEGDENIPSVLVELSQAAF